MRKFLTHSITALGLSFAASSANAALIVDFEAAPFADGSTSQNVVYDLGLGRTLTISVFTIDDNDGDGNIFARTQVLDPWGVYKGTTGLGAEINNNDSGSLDGADGNGSGDDFDEGILFSFNFDTELLGINFGSWHSDDDFNLEVDGVNLMHDVGAFDTNSFIDFTPEDDKFVFQNVLGRNFLVWADGDSDSFRIDDIVVNDVPEPSAIALLGLSLLLLGRVKRN